MNITKPITPLVTAALTLTTLSATAQELLDTPTAQDISDTLATALEDTGEPHFTETSDIEFIEPEDTGEETEEILIGDNSDLDPISVSLPQEVSVDDSVQLDNGQHVFVSDGTANDVSVVVEQASDNSVRFATILQTPHDPHRFTYDVGIPANGRIVLNEDGKSGIVVDENDDVLLFIAPAWAVDANGQEIPTHFETSDNELIQVIEPAHTATYPITADPWLGQRLFDKVTKTYKGYTYSTYPSWIGRSLAASAATTYVKIPARRAFWSEAKTKGVPATNKMQDQLYCHIDGFAFFKSSWNLDTWRPDVSYAATLAAGCNPK